MTEEKINHPKHYGGAENPHEAIKVIEAWRVGFCTGNAIKYISRAGRKDGASFEEDCRKALWYLKREKGLGEVSPLMRRTMASNMGPLDVATAWGLSGALGKVLKAIYDGNTGSAARLLEETIAALGSAK